MPLAAAASCWTRPSCFSGTEDRGHAPCTCQGEAGTSAAPRPKAHPASQACTHAQGHPRVHTQAHTCTHTHAQGHPRVRAHRGHGRTHTGTHTHIHIHMRAHTHPYAHMGTRAHGHVRACTHGSRRQNSTGFRTREPLRSGRPLSRRPGADTELPGPVKTRRSAHPSPGTAPQTLEPPALGQHLS